MKAQIRKVLYNEDEDNVEIITVHSLGIERISFKSKKPSTTFASYIEGITVDEYIKILIDSKWQDVKNPEILAIAEDIVRSKYDI